MSEEEMNETSADAMGAASTAGAAENIDIDKLTFKQGLEELSNIVHLLESNQLELEDSIERYKQGVEILANLQKRLNEAQLTVTELMGKLDDEDMGDIDTRISQLKTARLHTTYKESGCMLFT